MSENQQINLTYTQALKNVDNAVGQLKLSRIDHMILLASVQKLEELVRKSEANTVLPDNPKDTKVPIRKSQ